jgi:hypothetical protein
VSPVSHGEAYTRAVAELAAAAERERQLIEAANASTGAMRALTEARQTLQTVGADPLLRPARASSEKGTVPELQRLLREQEDAALARAAEVAATVSRLASDADADARRREIQQDLLWRLPLPLLVGLVLMGIASGAMPLFLAVAIGAVAATVVAALVRPYVLLQLRAGPGRVGLDESDIGIVAGGAAATVLGVVGSAIAAGAAPGQRALAVGVAIGGAYVAGRCLAAVRRSRG